MITDTAMTIRVPRAITYDDLAGLLQLAFEGGSNHFIDTLDLDYEPEEKGDETKYGFWADFPQYMVNAPDYRLKVGFDGEEKILDLPTLKKGMEVMAQKFPDALDRWFDDMADAEEGDVFLQCCLLGDVIYG